MKTKSTMKILTTAIWVIFTTASLAETNWEIQAVDGNGYSTCPKEGATYADTNNKVIITGIVLNNPEDIVSTAANYNTTMYNIGGQWEIYVQGLTDDHAGTAVWMGQNYANRYGTGRYTNEGWEAELNRINIVNYIRTFEGTDITTPHQIRQGDLVRVTGFILEYNGKANINERHDTLEDLNFTVEWLENTPGLPEPEVITLSEVKDSTDADIFDANRLTGGEYYQARLVRINNVHIVSGTFAADGLIYIGDNTGRTIRVKLGFGTNFNTNNLNSTFDVVGIFDQEYGYTNGYRLWVTGYNGGQTLLGVVPPMQGDVNGDGSVNVSDLSLLAANYGRDLKAEGISSAEWRMYGDLNGDGIVNVSDLSLLAANYNSSSSNAISWADAYAQTFGTTCDTDAFSEDSSSNATQNTDETTNTVCSSLGLSLIAVLAMMGLAIVKLEE